MVLRRAFRLDLVETLKLEGKIKCLFRFCDGRSGGVDGGVEVDDGNTAVGGEVDAVFGDACLSCLICCLDLNF